MRIVYSIGVAVEGGAVAGEEDNFKVVVSEDLSGEVEDGDIVTVDVTDDLEGLRVEVSNR